MNKIYLSICMLISQFAWANPDSTFLKAEKTSPRYCKPRIVGMSPNKVISVGFDYEFGQTLKSSVIGSFDKKENVDFIETTTYKRVSGLRFTAKAPLINKPKLIWQLGLNYWRANYIKDKSSSSNPPMSHYFGAELTHLTTAGISTSIYKPLNNKEFLIFQVSADLNGDYTFKENQSLKYLRYSVNAIYGQRVNDRKQWAVGLARGYNAGQVTLLPVIMFNYTSPNKKWGTEILLPARAWYRYTINNNSLFRAGFELEGATYHISYLTLPVKNMELRRGQLRTKIEYQRKLYKSFWLSAQTGYCYMLNFNLDNLDDGDKDFSREFDSKRKYAIINDLSNFLFFNVSINFVSL